MLSINRRVVGYTGILHFHTWDVLEPLTTFAAGHDFSDEFRDERTAGNSRRSSQSPRLVVILRDLKLHLTVQAIGSDYVYSKSRGITIESSEEANIPCVHVG